MSAVRKSSTIFSIIKTSAETALLFLRLLLSDAMRVAIVFTIDAILLKVLVNALI